MNLTNQIINNMYNNGNIKDENMATFTTYDNQYRFELSRENAQLWYTDTSYKFKCKIKIYDNLTNNLLRTITCSEEDIKNILDCYTQMNDYCTQNIYVPPFNPHNSNGNFYFIEMELYRVNMMEDIMEDISSRWFNINEYNPLNNTTVRVISIKMDVDELEELIDIMYFIFLIDIESNPNSLIPYNEAPSEYNRYNR